MQTRREQSLKSIGELLTRFSDHVTNQNSIGFTDINKSSENFFITILNISYQLQLIDMNKIQDNYPAIDLGDYASRICIQVTSESSGHKLRHTIKTFKEKGLSAQFDKIIFLIISNKNLCTANDTSVQTEVINLNLLYKQIAKLNDDNIHYINEYLKNELLSSVEPSSSILPSRVVGTFQLPYPSRLIAYLGFDNEPEYAKKLVVDLNNFSKILKSLSNQEREFLFYLVAHGQFPQTCYGIDETSVIVTTAQANQDLGQPGHQAFTSLRARGLVDLDDDYDPFNDGRYTSVIRPYFLGELDDTDIFSSIRCCCNSDINVLHRIFVGCDFTNLAN